ncbi:recombinase family protein [Persephonella sp.]
MKTYAYIRISTDKQDLENQKFAILQYVNNANPGIKPLKVYLF